MTIWRSSDTTCFNTWVPSFTKTLINLRTCLQSRTQSQLMTERNFTTKIFRNWSYIYWSSEITVRMVPLSKVTNHQIYFVLFNILYQNNVRNTGMGKFRQWLWAFRRMTFSTVFWMTINEHRTIWEHVVTSRGHSVLGINAITNIEWTKSYVIYSSLILPHITSTFLYLR